ncbi:NAD dependent epimerase dehydratase family [Fusarium denticulatum]|uniref:NAD dependent epimerase dehydratase family n=1 Tax=Fusarium denticulatum TaxID=48507 RepID=A0A8H5XLB5_9HYPO|nr:NAD dependent epimerase dehydratase family [Fusarium denticulatum]
MSSVPPGGLILITGANDYIVSVAVQVFIKRGYRVRGTVRSITVPDISTPGAFDEALQGVDGVAHMTMNMDMNPQNQGAIEDTINSNLCVRSSTTGEPYKIDATTWNTDAIDKTTEPWDGQGDPRWHGIVLYGAAKARSEQAAFAWVREHKPSFSFNTIVPNINFGIAISPENMSYRSSAAVIDAVVKGYPDAPSILPSQ